MCGPSLVLSTKGHVSFLVKGRPRLRFGLGTGVVERRDELRPYLEGRTFDVTGTRTRTDGGPLVSTQCK